DAGAFHEETVRVHPVDRGKFLVWASLRDVPHGRHFSGHDPYGQRTDSPPRDPGSDRRYSCGCQIVAGEEPLGGHARGAVVSGWFWWAGPSAESPGAPPGRTFFLTASSPPLYCRIALSRG